MSVTRAWLALLALSAASTLLSLGISSGQWLKVLGFAILAIAWAKARIIAARYLGLSAVPALLRGFAIVLGLFQIALLGLYLLA